MTLRHRTVRTRATAGHSSSPPSGALAPGLNKGAGRKDYHTSVDRLTDRSQSRGNRMRETREDPSFSPPTTFGSPFLTQGSRRIPGGVRGKLKDPQEQRVQVLHLQLGGSRWHWKQLRLGVQRPSCQTHSQAF